jgi:glutathione-specific gamma-glutamylcyclotransferase
MVGVILTSVGRRQRSHGPLNQMLDPISEFAPADPMPPEIAALRNTAEPVWIFAYGSLMWDQDFPRSETETALLRGYHRSFCLYSYDYRGTRTRPGLTLGLDHGGACRGIALRLPAAGLGAAIDRLWAREMNAPRVYDMRLLPVQTAYGARKAFAFTVRRDHPDYASLLSLDERARIIAEAAGRRGACRAYLADTVRHLGMLDIADAPLQRLAERVNALAATPIG